MTLKNKILVCLLLPLVVLGAKPVIAEPIEIEELSKLKVYAFEKVLLKWDSTQWDSFDKLIEKESHWDSEAKNPKSSATGIGQFLNSTWETVGCKKTSDPYKQIDCTIDYIKARYKTPKDALEFHKINNWY